MAWGEAVFDVMAAEDAVGFDSWPPGGDVGFDVEVIVGAVEVGKVERRAMIGGDGGGEFDQAFVAVSPESRLHFAEGLIELALGIIGVALVGIDEVKALEAESAEEHFGMFSAQDADFGADEIGAVLEGAVKWSRQDSEFQFGEPAEPAMEA